MASENPEMDMQENTPDTHVEVAVLADNTGAEGQAEAVGDEIGEHAEQLEIDSPEAKAAEESNAESSEQEASDEAEANVLVVNDAPGGDEQQSETLAELAGELTPEVPSTEEPHAEVEDNTAKTGETTEAAEEQSIEE